MAVVSVGSLMGASQAARAQAGYSIVDLGTLGGTGPTYATGINQSGQVTGYSPMIGGGDHAFLWTSGATNGSLSNPQMQDLGTLLGGGTSFGYGVNDAGQVAGQSFRNANMDYHAFRTSANSAINPVTDDQGTLGGTYSAAYGINASGQTTGYSNVSNGSGGNGAQHAFRATGSGVSVVFQDLSPGSSVTSLGRAINASGQVTGQFGSHAFLTMATGTINPTTSDLGTLGGSSSDGFGINSVGHVVGRSNLAGDAVAHAFLFSGGQMTDLGELPGTGNDYGTGFAVNSFDMVVGSSRERAFLYQGGQMLDLNSLINPDSGWLLTAATAINDNGQIAGDGFVNGEYHAFMLSPIPEPSTWALALTGAGLLGMVARRRSQA